MASPTRTIVMTGSSSGFGRSSALHMLQDPGVALATIHRTRTLPSHDRLHDDPVDMADRSAVRAWVDGVAARLDAGDLPPLHAVVGNAGLQVADGPRRSAQGLDRTMAVNHLAHVLIVDRLLSHLTPGGRVVVTSSGTHHGGLLPRLLGVPGPREEPIARTADPDTVAPGPRTGRRQYSTPARTHRRSRRRPWPRWCPTPRCRPAAATWSPGRASSRPPRPPPTPTFPVCCWPTAGP